MSVAEMKKEINEKIDKLNEEQLKIILKVIEEASVEQKKAKFDAELFFEEVVLKYGNVLQKLAQ
ncbi:hypothetical protein FW778_07930 [Ginsengibacter hankyongi]|uniref:Uncharacterized protein n=1 Tax=Ginsengibacter hankyongi TaxID=2607284 RepID=A0A5J5IQV4_9BACT|nr:hypothetical protein [Ginsengibacter hankyongi]KAA9041932.1 hypothetical protein FW778_07930 [Ginsengibacter hankyongi]